MYIRLHHPSIRIDDMCNVHKPMTWFEAYTALYLSKESVLGKHAKMKSVCAHLAVLLFLFTPFYVASLNNEYSGRRPPEAPLIKSWGVLNYIPPYFDKVARDPYMEFRAENGVVYRVGYTIGPTDVYDLVRAGRPGCPGYEGKAGCPRRIYMEGFLLRDGKGPLWPTFVASEEGVTLVSRERLNNILRSGDGGPTKLGYIMYSAGLLFAVITLINMYFLKQKNSLKE